ncbi:Mu transposase C-terminal domain-containing protein [Nonomuraea typhae]|uniref:Mu transposase C-terminal domain-containing protein n=1 Tax=Nonomuraea typhae TaxID=2603600 RepID=A0ABW7Z6S7_9ACTN
MLALDQRGELTAGHLRLLSECLPVSERTLWRWLKTARCGGRCERKPHTRFTITKELRVELALLGGNASHLHRELVARAGDEAVPSLATIHRAIRRDLSPGEIAGLRQGERARRAFDVWLQRPKGPGHEDQSHRNLVWEGDHKQLPIEVDVEGQLRRPWVTWFVDCATNGICGLAVTPVYPSRESILVALCAAIVRDPPYGPFGGLPAAIRVDRGKDFLSHTVGRVLGRFAVHVGDLPGYSPWLKGTVEELNHAVEEMFLRALPRYTHQPRLHGDKPVDPDAPALTFAGFVGLLLDWVGEWNGLLPKSVLGGRTPEQAWLADPTPIDDVPAADLRLMMLEDDGRIRVIRPDGVQWDNHMYVDGWMHGQAGRRVRLRYMPHHDHEIEVFDARDGAHLGTAFLAHAASDEQRARVLSARRSAQKELERTLRAAARKRRERYAAVTTAQSPRQLGRLTEAEAAAELDAAYRPLPRSPRRPDLFPLPEPAAGWVVPAQPPAEEGKEPS